MAIQEGFQVESVGSDQIFHIEPDEKGRANYQPRVLAQIEDEADADADTFVAEEFLMNWVESEPGKSSPFLFAIPVGIPPNNKPRTGVSRNEGQ